jgi:hypothetical protein
MELLSKLLLPLTFIYANISVVLNLIVHILHFIETVTRV